MNISIADKNKTVQAENSEKIKQEKGDNEVLTNAYAPFADFLQGQISENMNIKDTNLLPDIDFSYDTVSMDLTDALFFVNLTQDGLFSMQPSQNGEFQNLIKTEIVQNTITQKTINVTNQLTSLIEKAQNTQKPVRISFDNDISVILKINKQGKVSAEFIPGSIEAENYLMNNVASLKQKFDEQNLPYTSLSYRQQNRQGRNKDKNRGEA